MRPRSATGSATVEAVLVVPLLLLLGAAVMQVALVLHVRSALTAAAAEAARAAALAGATPGAASVRVATLLDGSVAGATVHTVRQGLEVEQGVQVIAVRIDAVLPLVGLYGPTSLSVEGHSVPEAWS